MTNKEQRDWIRGLIEGVQKEIFIKSHDFPEDWDIRELRWYTKDQFDKVVWPDKDKRGASATLYKKYYNDCLINNL